MSLTLTFTGNTSVLTTDFFPPIHLNGENWSCGLLNFEAYNSIPNVDDTNNCIHIVEGKITVENKDLKDLHELAKSVRSKLGDVKLEVGTFISGKIKIKCSKTLYNYDNDSMLEDLGFNNKRVLEANIEHYSDNEMKRTLTKRTLHFGKIFRLPKGSYELEDIAREVKQYGIEIEPIRNQLKCKVKCNKNTLLLDSNSNSVGSLLGFTQLHEVPEGKEATSDHVVDIFKVNAIAIECSIISGSWKNGQPSHIIHQFFPNVSPGYKVIEAPQSVVYLDLQTNILDTVTLRIVDQEGRLVDFRGETITVRLHLKRQQ